MKRDSFYTVMSHYDKDGLKTRSVRQVHGRAFSYKGYIFGIYLDGSCGLYRLIDLATGKQIHHDTDLNHAISRLRIKPFFDWFVNQTKTDDYRELCIEYDQLILKWEAEHKCVS